MTDAVLNRPEDGVWDFSIGEDGGIEIESFFDTAILVSIYENKRASESEVQRPELRRGWIGNESTPDFERGSKIWLYHQSRLTRTIINNIISAANDSLAWIVTDGFALNIVTDVNLKNGAVTLVIQIQRPDGQVVNKFLPLWDNSGVTEAK